MAAFKTHVTAGLVVGYFAGTFAVITRLIFTPLTPLAMFAAAFIGSFLPDLDSDYGKPFNIIFSMAGVAGGSIAFYYFLHKQTIPWLYWIAVPPVIALLIRYVAGDLFRKFTKHRGIFHSIPAMGIATFTTPLTLIFFDLLSRDVIAISLSVGLGFLSHLVLDEVYSTVNFEGMRWKPKKSLGTALAFTAPSKKVTTAAYVLLIVLFVLNFPLVQKLL